MISIRLQETNHYFVKQNLVTQTDNRGIYDLYRCSQCGVTGKSRRLGIVEIPNKESKKASCPNAPKITRVRVTQCNAFGSQFKNLTPNSEHDTIEPPPGENNDRGCWVMGVGEPVLLLVGEFNIVS